MAPRKKAPAPPKMGTTTGGVIGVKQTCNNLNQARYMCKWITRVNKHVPDDPKHEANQKREYAQYVVDTYLSKSKMPPEGVKHELELMYNHDCIPGVFRRRPK